MSIQQENLGLAVQASSEVRVLTYKLDKIRTHIQNRLDVVDDITKSELEFILNLISKFEVVPADYELLSPIVPESNIPKEYTKRRYN